MTAVLALCWIGLAVLVALLVGAVIRAGDRQLCDCDDVPLPERRQP